VENNHTGFTFIEVLVAMLIFVLAVLAAINIARGSVRATKDAREVTIATWLLQNVMVELETRIETEGFDKGCEKKKQAKFDVPYDNYTWTTYCDDIDFHISETAAQIANQSKDKDKNSSSDDASVDSEKTDQMQKMVLDTASDYISKSIKELHAEVNWMQGKTKRTVDVTTHIARYDLPLSLPGMGGTTPGAAGTTTTPGASSTPSSSPTSSASPPGVGH
jgi:type II secretion system protein I